LKNVKAPRREINGRVEKQCTICNGWYPETEEYFYMCNKNKPEKGFVAQCKKCSSKLSADRQYKRYHEGNLKEYYDKLYLEKRSDLLDYQHRYYRDNEKRRIGNAKSSKKFRLTHPERVKEHSQYRYQHKKHKISTKEWELCKQYFDYSCAYCGMTEEKHEEIMHQQLHKEHVNHFGSNGLENCVPACKKCNSSKHTYELDEWYNENNPNFLKARYDKIKA